MWVTNCRNYSGESSNIRKRFGSTERPLFLLVLSNSEIATVTGISGAGSSQKYVQYTPAADAEIVSYGKLKTIRVMSDAPSGTATPAVLTRAGLNLSQSAHFLINSGLQIIPGVPYYDLRAKHGYDIRFRPGVPDASTIRDASRKLAGCCECDLAVIGESIPGGTTTALCVLRALGYSGNVSSSFAANPTALKEKVVRKAMQAASIRPGSLQGDPMRAIKLFGDPMMPCVVGLTEGFINSGKDVVLAGGTQMGTVAAVLKELNLSDDLVLATTKYVFDDTSARFVELIEALEIDAFSAYPNFSKSSISALQKYEQGEVKEGVGAGGAMALTCIAGFGQDAYRREVEAVIKQL
ncbi:MAG: nicotinate mononucleotide-dependent phosphoribosyltransferase CobT [Halobacteriota archaeon]